MSLDVDEVLRRFLVEKSIFPFENEISEFLECVAFELWLLVFWIYLHIVFESFSVAQDKSMCHRSNWFDVHFESCLYIAGCVESAH